MVAEQRGCASLRPPNLNHLAHLSESRWREGWFRIWNKLLGCVRGCLTLIVATVILLRRLIRCRTVLPSWMVTVGWFISTRRLSRSLRLVMACACVRDT
jgi:hypothetical protein